MGNGIISKGQQLILLEKHVLYLRDKLIASNGESDAEHIIDLLKELQELALKDNASKILIASGLLNR